MTKLLVVVLALVVRAQADSNLQQGDLNGCTVHQYLSCDDSAQCVEENGDPTQWKCVCPTHLEGDGLKGENRTGCGPKKCGFDRECHTFAFCNVDAVCECKKGYGGDGRAECTDVNECTASPCHANARCENTDGSFKCTCKMEEGYVGNGFNCSHTCSVDYDCGNITRYRCAAGVCICRPGYRMGQSTCTDVNECLESRPCHRNATCVNTDGSYNCSCNNGFTGDGKACEALPRNCHEILTKNANANSGTYTIDPDFEGPINATKVECLMRPGLGITIMSPVVTSAQRVYNNRPTIEYQYNNPIDAIKGVIATSGYCYQEMSYRCWYNARLMDGDDFWINGNKEQEENWGGAISNRMCACGQMRFCANRTSNCNCDGSGSNLEDRGRILDKTKLPILGVVSTPGNGYGIVNVYKLNCAPRPFDIPIDCHDAKFNTLYKIKTDGPQVVDFDGPTGPLTPVMVHCDMKTYPHTGVTVVPHTQSSVTPQSPGTWNLNYVVTVPHLQGLIGISVFCSQEAEYTCKNSRLLNNGNKRGYYSDTAGNAKKFWAGGLGDNQCGCNVTGTCASENYGCNCDIMDGVTRKDWGVITDKTALPIGSVTLLDIGGTSTGTFNVGSLQCSQREFGILATCQKYLDDGRTLSHTYLVDPDGPSNPNQPNNGNQPPFPVYCEFVGDPVYANTVVYHQYKTQISVTLSGSFSFLYHHVSTLQLKALTKRSVSCTQTVKYTCRNAPIHYNGQSMVKWMNIDGQFLSYFAGDGVKPTACSCGLTTPSICSGGGLCQCDVADNTNRTDDGLLVKKEDLPILQMVYSGLGAYSAAELGVGPLVCKELFPTCSDMRVYNERYRLESEYLPPNGNYVIDPDGPQGVIPFLVTCTGKKTTVPIDTNPDGPTDGLPDKGVSKCYDITYMSNGKPVSPEQVLALVQSSTYCAQKLSHECQNAPLTGHSNYTTCDGVVQPGWAGSKGENKCACGVTGSCAGGPQAKCNCDLVDGVTREDRGYLVEKGKMPVCRVCVSLDPANSVTSSPKMRRVKPVVSDLECDSSALGLGPTCQSFRNSKETDSDVRWIDPDGTGPTEPFPVACVLKSYPPMGWTEIYPKQPEIVVPPTGIDTVVEYYVFNLTFAITLIKASGYCTQELKLVCQNSGLQLGTYGWYSRDGVIQKTWSGGCNGTNCKCNVGGYQIDGGVITDDSLLPIKRIVLGPASGSRTLQIGPVKCFDLYKDCEDIRRNGARSTNPLNNDTYAIDPDAQGLTPPFAVTCDFRTTSGMGITVVQVLPSVSKRIIRNAGHPGVFKVPMEYDAVTYVQIQELAKISGFCHQGIKYLCYKSPLINRMSPAYTFYDTFAGRSSSFGVAGYSDTIGCACMATKTCPQGHSCHCDDVGRMTPDYDYGAEINRTVLPITQLNFGGQSAASSSVYEITGVRCAPKPFDLPKDCDDVYNRNLMTGEHLIWPSTAVKPFLVYCDLDILPNGGVTVIGNDMEPGLPVTYGSTIRVTYHNADSGQLDAITNVAKFCYQPFMYKCRNTKMLSGGGYFYWRGRYMTNYEMFAGAGRHFARECNCGTDGLCGGSENKTELLRLERPCNCDAADEFNRADAGIFKEKSKMPVKEMTFHPTGIAGSYGFVKLGKLYCSNTEFDMDECTTGFHDCNEHAQCINKPGSYDCFCKPGWRGLGREDVWANGRNCYDDDECAMNMCPWSSNCTNLPGSFECKCHSGFLQTGKRKCDDIDECALGVHSCHVNARCINLPGGYDCRCNRNYRGDGFTCEPLALCACFGDPHCITSDARLVDYQGLCQYTMARDQCQDPTLAPTFEVLTLHYQKPGIEARKGASWVKEVTINYNGMSVLLMQNHEVRVDGLRVNTPYRRTHINIQRYGQQLLVSTLIGVEVRWNGDQNVEVYTPAEYKNNTCGLCGNYNGDPSDDLVVGPECPAHAGSQTDNFNIFGNSWVVPEYVAANPQCAANCSEPNDPGVCTGLDYSKAKYECDKLYKPNGKFKDCFHEMESTFYNIYYRSCIYDMCRIEGDVEAAICAAAALLAANCLQEYHVKVGNYREKGFCEIDCGENMEYTTQCHNNPTTCMDYLTNSLPPAVSDNSCQEGCFCKQNYIMEGNKCILPANCGCVYMNTYYKVGEVMTGEGCVNRKTCYANHTMVGDDIECHEYATCKLQDGVYGCHCLDGYFGDGITMCVEDPCEDEPCGGNETCVRDFSEPNGYLCECDMGFVGDCGNCSEIDECLTATDDCPAHSNCINTVGSYRCECEPGYRMYAKQCEDVDECILAEIAGDSLCGNNSRCINTIGSYQCPCCEGYEQALNGTCIVSTTSPYKNAPRCCVCETAICNRPGNVCGEDGLQYNSLRDMIISNCEKGLASNKFVQVDYYSRCKSKCSDVSCPKYQHCVTNEKTGKPTCVCDECTPEEVQRTEPVCTDMLDIYPTFCLFKKVQCSLDAEATVLPSMIPCEGKGGDSPLGPWSPWGPCSVTCGKGLSTKTRQAYTEAARDSSVLALTTDCYEEACPGGPCDIPNACDNAAEECVVLANSEKVCECPTCENIGVEPVCGFVEGIQGGEPITWKSACFLQKTACENDAEDFEVMHQGACGDVPLYCTRVPNLQYVRGGENNAYISNEKVNLYECEGGCGHDTKYCCQPSRTEAIALTLYNSTLTPNQIYQGVTVIKECDCVETPNVP